MPNFVLVSIDKFFLNNKFKYTCLNFNNDYFLQIFKNIFSSIHLAKEICGTPRDDCSLYATCQDTGPDTYTCKCNEGYTGDGKNCTGLFLLLLSLDLNLIVELSN